jgi:hypothetical protein
MVIELDPANTNSVISNSPLFRTQTHFLIYISDSPNWTYADDTNVTLAASKMIDLESQSHILMTARNFQNYKLAPPLE